MTRDEWDGLSLFIEAWWPGEFPDVMAEAWRAALGDFDREAVLSALKARLARGDRWRPAVSEVVAEIRKDPTKPTFEEAQTLIYGRGGVLKARPEPGQRYANEAAMLGARDDAAQARACELHPLLASFVERYGVARLRNLELGDPEWGQVRLRELREAWDRHCEAMEDRDVAELVAGRRGELAAFDPLRALGPRRLELEDRAS